MVGDAELAIAAAGGDRVALGRLYDRYADGIYELCRAIVADSREAGDVVQDTFVTAAARFRDLRDKDGLKPWLAAIARYEALRRTAEPDRNRRSTGEVVGEATVEPSPDRVFGNDAANLVWTAARSLTERERAVLALHARHGFAGTELAEVAGLRASTASAVLDRATSQLAVALRCTLLVRFGRPDCEGLSAIGTNSAELDAAARTRVARHATRCATCAPRWNASPDALAILATAPMLGAPSARKRKLLDDPRLIGTSRPEIGRHWRRDGFPPLAEKSRRLPIVTRLAAAALFGLVATALVLAGDDDARQFAAPGSDAGAPGGRNVAGSVVTFAPGTPVTTPDGGFVTRADGSLVTIAPGTPVTNPDGSVVTSPSNGSTRTTDRQGSTGSTNPGSATTPPATEPGATSTSTPARSAIRITASAGQSELSQCGRKFPDRSPVSATTDIPSDGTLWLHSQGIPDPIEMTPAGPNAWNATLGPFPPSSSERYAFYVSDSPDSGGTKSDSHDVVVHSC